MDLSNKFQNSGVVEIEEATVTRNRIEGAAKGFKFDSRTHTYTLNGIVLLSTTQFMEMFIRPFERAYVSAQYASKNKANNKKYLIDALDVRRYWSADGDRMSSLGTSCHAFCVCYWLNPEGTIPVNKIEENAKKLMDSLMREFYILEMEVNRGNQKYMMGYTMDIVLQQKTTGNIFIGDFKFARNFTSEQYKDSKGRDNDYLLAPFKELKMRASVEHKGQIQLNIYKKFYEMETGKKVKGCFLFHVDGTNVKEWYDGKGYKVYAVPDLSKTIDFVLRSQEKVSFNVLKNV